MNTTNTVLTNVKNINDAYQIIPLFASYVTYIMQYATGWLNVLQAAAPKIQYWLSWLSQVFSPALASRKNSSMAAVYGSTIYFTNCTQNEYYLLSLLIQLIS